MDFTKARHKDIIASIADKAGVPQVLAGQVYYALSEVIEENLKAGKEVRIPYIGAFYFYKMKAMVSNLTGQKIPIHHKIKFRFRPELARYIRVMSREN